MRTCQQVAQVKLMNDASPSFNGLESKTMTSKFLPCRLASMRVDSTTLDLENSQIKLRKNGQDSKEIHLQRAQRREPCKSKYDIIVLDFIDRMRLDDLASDNDSVPYEVIDALA